MSHLWNLVKKELKELLTPSSLISVIVVMFLFIAMGSFMGGETKNMTSLQPIGFVDLSEDAINDYAQIGLDGVSQYYASQQCDPAEYIHMIDVTSQYGTEAFDNEIYDAMVNQGVDTVLVIMPSFNTDLDALSGYGQIVVYWNQTSLGIFSSISLVTSETAISLFNTAIRVSIMESEMTGLTDDQIMIVNQPCISPAHSTFLKGKIHQGITHDQIYGALSQQNMFVPIIIMLIIVMIGSIVISSMGNEKENKTLETLLTLPVNRTTIVAGKLIGSTIAGLIMCMLYMIGMFFYISGTSITASSKNGAEATT